MKPFNLEEALAGKPVVTRDGRPVKIAGYNEEATEGSQVIGWLEGLCYDWYKNGLYLGDDRDHPQDIFMAPEKREVWACYYRKDGLQCVSLGNSKGAAEIIPYSDKSIIVTTIKIWEEEI